MDWLITFIIVSSFSMLLSSVIFDHTRLGTVTFSWYIGVTECSFSIPISEHGDVGFESLSRRLWGFSLSSRDGFGEFIDCVAFTDLSLAILLDDIETCGLN